MTNLDYENKVSVAEIEEFSLLFNAFFGFRENPFNNTPDPNFFFMSQKHKEILMNMLFGIHHRKGFILVTGEIGAGKTTLCRQFLHQLPEHIKTAVVLNPTLSGTHLLASIVHDFGIDCQGKTKKHYFDALNAFLLEGLERNQNACLIIDEAQRLSPKVMEEIRLLSNLETSQQKLLQIIMMGQPELKDILMRPSLTQLRQRLGVFCHLKALDRTETRDYILHRLQHVREGNCDISLDHAVIAKIYEASHGIPRLINALCDRLLLAGFHRQTREITWGLAESAFEETSFLYA